ncbi:MAG TPA: hypothetical protein VNA25_12210, partial [Phycisphaerae bacterium]|nr:hypothetical protein [Phycisphaerae bacterium]
TLLRILRSLGGDWKHHGKDRARPVPPAVRRIHDLFYLDMRNGREFYNSEKARDADTLAQIAEVVARYIPRPPPVKPDGR